MVALGVLVLSGTGAVAAIPSTPAGALPPATCTWTGTTNQDWSVAANWSGGASCTVAGGPQAGSMIVFPPGGTTDSVAYDSGTEVGGGGTAPASTFDSITFEDSYDVMASGGPSDITLTPTSATPCGTSTTIALCVSGAADSDAQFDPGVVMGEPEDFATVPSTDLSVNGDVSGTGPLSTNSPTRGGVVVLGGDNSYTGGTTVGYGLIGGDSTQSFSDPSEAITDDDGGIVQICTPSITMTYTLHLGAFST